MKRRKIGKSWSRRIRKVGGKRKAVKVRRRGGKLQTRVIGKWDYTDKDVSRRKRKARKRFFYDSTDSGPRMHHIRRHKRKRMSWYW